MSDSPKVSATKSTLEESYISVHESTAIRTSSRTSSSTSTRSSSIHSSHHSSREHALQQPVEEASAKKISEKESLKLLGQEVVPEPTTTAAPSPPPHRLELSSHRRDLVSNLQTRLRQAQFPEQLAGSGWAYGTEASILESLKETWLNEYNWEYELSKLNNEFEHWTCQVQGLEVHYVRHDPWAASEDREKAGGAGAWEAGKTEVNDQGEIVMPLLLIHGWPGSWYEFAKALELLKKRGRFQIIVPSLPGFGWSQAPTTKKFGVRAMAKILHELMQRLGYKHYLAQGGDWGAMISRTLATLYPDNCLAIHINMLPCLPPRPWTQPFQFAKAITGFLLPSVIYKNQPRARASVEGLKVYAKEEGGYFLLQSTKPQTLGYALQDSPVGLLAWLTEKYLGWSDLDPARPETWPFSRTELLNQIMIYHSTGTITSSIRIYYETYHARDTEWLLTKPVPPSVPVGVGVWNKELFMVPRAWAQDWMNIVSWHEFPKGGHFAAFERPVEFEKEITEFFTREEVLDAFTAKRHGFKI